MGFAPWKFNNTGNQIGILYSQSRFGQRIPDVLRQPADEHLNEQLKLFFCWLEDGVNAVDHCSYDDLERFSKGDIPKFIRKEVEDLP